MNTTHIRKTEHAIDRFITKIEMDGRDLDAIAWDNLGKIARCEAISDMLRAFYARNKELIGEFRKSYNNISTYGEDEDLLDLFRKVASGVDPKYGCLLSDWDLNYMAPAFFNLLDPAAKRVKLDEGMARYLARKQKWICPICKQKMNVVDQAIEVDHDRAWCKVGDRINSVNLRAVHAGCNDKKMGSYLAHTDLHDYLYII